MAWMVEYCPRHFFLHFSLLVSFFHVSSLDPCKFCQKFINFEWALAEYI